MVTKPLMELHDNDLSTLQNGTLTGMSFWIFLSGNRFFVSAESGVTLPLQSDAKFYSLEDLLQGVQLPTSRLGAGRVKLSTVYASRFQAVQALQQAKISPAYTGSTGAHPLIAQAGLPAGTVLQRLISSPTDRRYVAGKLTAGTYLTSNLDAAYVNTGFGAVGRYALPLPLPIQRNISYTLTSPTTVELGTVAPNFGQSGGGVEIRLTNDAPANASQVLSLPQC